MSGDPSEDPLKREGHFHGQAVDAPLPSTAALVHPPPLDMAEPTQALLPHLAYANLAGLPYTGHIPAGPSGEDAAAGASGVAVGGVGAGRGTRGRAATPPAELDGGRPPAKRARVSGSGEVSASGVARHIVTEQQRRDREKAGFAALRELIPMEDKLDKATFLKRVVAYISELQDVMQQLLQRGTLNCLPTDMQWSVRMLLPRQATTTSAAAPAAAARAPQQRSQATPPPQPTAQGPPSSPLPAGGSAGDPAAAASGALLSSAALLPLLGTAPPVQAPLNFGVQNLALNLSIQALVNQQVLQAALGAMAGQGPAPALPQVASPSMAFSQEQLQQLLQQPLLPGLPGAAPPLAGLGLPAVSLAASLLPVPPCSTPPPAVSAPLGEGGSRSGAEDDDSSGGKPQKNGSKVRRQTAATLAPRESGAASGASAGRPEPPA